MPDPQKQSKLRNIEIKLRDRYSLLSKLFLLIAILFIICIALIFIGITFLGLGYNWALFSLEGWIISLCVLLGVFIILELIIFIHFYSVWNKRIELGKPKPEFINGRQVHVFTYPKGTTGGIFSKTYVDIDENSILRLRSIMISPEELWSKKGE